VETQLPAAFSSVGNFIQCFSRDFVASRLIFNMNMNYDKVEHIMRNLEGRGYFWFKPYS